MRVGSPLKWMILERDFLFSYPCLSFLYRVATLSLSDTVYSATKKMRDLRVNSVIVTTANKPQGILT